jgi:hypothetical protein
MFSAFFLRIFLSAPMYHLRTRIVRKVQFSTTRAQCITNSSRTVARSCSLHPRWPATRTHLASCIIWRCETFSLLHSFIKLFK